MSPVLAGPGLLAIVVGAVAGTGLFLLVVAVRGLPPRPPGDTGRLRGWAREIGAGRAATAVFAGLVVVVATRWLVAGVGAALLVLSWRGLSGAAGERAAMARLEALATWTESLRDTIAGAVGLEQAIPASLRAAAPSLRDPLAALVERLHTRVPMPEALRRFADDLADPGADLIIAALMINARLRGPGLRDLLGALSRSVREELDVRRKVNAQRRSTRRGAQIVVGISVGLALGLALFNHAYVQVYDSVAGQLVLCVVVALYAVGVIWMRALARFPVPERLLAGHGAASGPDGAGPGGRPPGTPREPPEAVAAWRGGTS